MKLPSGWDFRPMKKEDISDVLEIIYDHDEDDGEWAEKTFSGSGVENHYVVTFEGKVAGSTGISYAEGTDGTYWLSWTYIDSDHQSQKIGTIMLLRLFDILKKQKARKVFVSLSDYVDPEDGPIYKKAIKLYKAAGFKEEIVHRDYYEPGEAEMIYGCTLAQPLPGRNEDDDRGIVLGELFEVDETEDVYAIDWEFHDGSCFTDSDLSSRCEKAKNAGARSVFISFPSNLTSVIEPLKAAGFSPCGMLEDFYKDGLHEFQFRYNC